jgi:hypothetical protein
MTEIKDEHISENCWGFLITEEQLPHNCQGTTEHINNMRGVYYAALNLYSTEHGSHTPTLMYLVTMFISMILSMQCL